MGAWLAGFFACGDPFTSGTGGAGGEASTPCENVGDCPAATDPCQSVTCQSSRCVIVYGQDNVPLPQALQTPGDCKQAICFQGQASAKSFDDPPDPEDCRTGYCEDGEVKFTFADPGTMCGTGAGLTCNGEGKCTGCGSSDDACGPSPLCKRFRCIEDTCELEVDQSHVQEDVQHDCLAFGCSEAGEPLSENDPNDVPPDETPQDCVEPFCNAGTVDSQPLENGHECGNGNG
ncbi:MAG: hypothetical protein KC731_01925, partial [Myxococcales bacterium]|nr:hypothetical protein [Myxococcales bacterium]